VKANIKQAPISHVGPKEENHDEMHCIWTSLGVGLMAAPTQEQTLSLRPISISWSRGGGSGVTTWGPAAFGQNPETWGRVIVANKVRRARDRRTSGRASRA